MYPIYIYILDVFLASQLWPWQIYAFIIKKFIVLSVYVPIYILK